MQIHSNKIKLRSPHLIEKCGRRLKESVDTSFFPYFPSKQIAGKISKHSISIRKKIGHRNSFQTVLRASLKQNEKETELVLTMGLHPFVKIVMLVWFGGFILIGGSILTMSLSSIFMKKSSVDIGTIMGILIPPGMVIFRIALLIFGKYLSKDENRVLIVFLRDLLDAKGINSVGHGA